VESVSYGLTICAERNAIFAAVAGAQLMARSRSDISLFDSLIDSYRVAGLLPA
jgi:TetR/AcrR family transcriptional repressor of nem operon